MYESYIDHLYHKSGKDIYSCPNHVTNAKQRDINGVQAAFQFRFHDVSPDILLPGHSLRQSCKVGRHCHMSCSVLYLCRLCYLRNNSILRFIYLCKIEKRFVFIQWTATDEQHTAVADMDVHHTDVPG